MLSRISGVRKRILFVFIAGIVVFVLLEFRLVWLQLVRGTWFQQQALANRIRRITVEPERGIIYDRRGRELAVSINADAVYAIPAEVKKSGKAQFIAQKLASILGLQEEEVYQRITQNQQSVWIKFKLEPEEAQKLRKLRLPGIGIIPKPQRFYPKKELAAHVLGIAGDYNQGLEGIELSYDKELAGISGRLLIECDAAGREIPEATHKYIPPQQGLNVVLTIDQTIQYIAERELEKVVQQWHPKSATIIVMDPNTGEILALANRPTFDPNNFKEYPTAARRNIAICNSYEPGSTLKIITLAAALEEGIVKENEHFYDPGYIKVGDRVIRCWNHQGHGDQTLAEVVQNSCNPGFISLGLRLGVDRFYKYLEAFGFGRPLGIDLPGEAKGLLMPKEKVTQVDLACISIGQGNAVTPIQLLSAVSAIANGGKLMKPYVVKELQNREGKVVKRFRPQVIRQVISTETARKVSRLLEGVVSYGTGRNAYIEGYAVAGKTGTAQKPLPGGGYSATEYIASFVGFAPSDDPRLAALIVVDSPQGYPYYGGTVAAPVFREVMRDSLRYLGVPMRYQPGEEQQEKKFVIVPSVVNLSVDEAEEILSQAGLRAVCTGEGSRVRSQVPPDGAQVEKGSEVLLDLGGFEIQNNSEVVVPELKGKSLREVAELLGVLDLLLVPEGDPYPTGVAVEQNPPAGVQVKPGTKIQVKFQAPLPLEGAP